MRLSPLLTPAGAGAINADFVDFTFSATNVIGSERLSVSIDSEAEFEEYMRKAVDWWRCLLKGPLVDFNKYFLFYFFNIYFSILSFVASLFFSSRLLLLRTISYHTSDQKPPLHKLMRSWSRISLVLRNCAIPLGTGRLLPRAREIKEVDVVSHRTSTAALTGRLH